MDIAQLIARAWVSPIVDQIFRLAHVVSKHLGNVDSGTAGGMIGADLSQLRGVDSSQLA